MVGARMIVEKDIDQLGPGELGDNEGRHINIRGMRRPASLARSFLATKLPPEAARAPDCDHNSFVNY